MSGQGFKSWISLIEESAYGTDPAGARDGYVRMITETMVSDESLTDLPGLGTRDVREMYAGHRVAGGGIVVDTGFEGGWQYLIKHAMGAYVFAVDTPEAGANSHYFSADDDLPIGLSMEISKGDIPTGKVFLYEGCKVDELAFSWESGGVLGCNASIIARDETEDTTKVDDPTYPSELPIKYNYLGTITIAGSTLTILSGSFTITNALERRFKMSRFTAEPLPSTLRAITGEVAAELEDLTHYTKFKEATAGDLELTWESALPMGSTSTPYTFKITAAAMKITTQTPQVSGAGVIQMPVSFKVEGSNQAVITVINEETTL